MVTVDRPVPVQIGIMRVVPHREIFEVLLSNGLVVAGGFPLWLIGGASFSSDIDIYPFNSEQHSFACDYLTSQGGVVTETTPHTTVYSLAGEKWQVVKPYDGWKNIRDILYTTDLTPSACVLTYVDGEFFVTALYPDDIANRICRIVIHHDWTWHRVRTYIAKGYEIDFDGVLFDDISDKLSENSA